MTRLYIAGIAMTVFGRHLERSLHDLDGEALQGALKDAGCVAADIGAAYYSGMTNGALQGIRPGWFPTKMSAGYLEKVGDKVVTGICPGWFPTKMSAGYLEKVGDKVVTGTPLHRIGREDEIKGAAVLFASEASRHVTGQYLAVDGGACIAC